MSSSSLDSSASLTPDPSSLQAVSAAVGVLQDAEAQFTQTVEGAKTTLQDAETRFAQALDNAIAELGPKMDATWERIKFLREQLAILQKNPIPAAEFGEFIAGYVDTLARVGKSTVLNHLNKSVAHVIDTQSINVPKDFAPLSFLQIEGLLQGEVGGPVISPLPLADNGSLSPEVMMFLFGDVVKTKLGELLEETPITYRTSFKGGFEIGSGISVRRTEIETTRTELADLELQYKQHVADMTALQQKKRARL